MPIIDSFNFQRRASKEDLALSLEGNVPPAEGKSIIFKEELTDTV